jgi:hypothetical protein
MDIWPSMLLSTASVRLGIAHGVCACWQHHHVRSNIGQTAVKRGHT